MNKEYYEGQDKVEAKTLVSVSATTRCSTHDLAIDALRGSLQNCVNHLERAKRKSNKGDYDRAIEQANKTLYETLVR